MRKPSPPNIVTVAILTTMTIVFWIFFSVYRILTSETDININPQLLEPISPNIDQEALQGLNQRLYFNKNEVSELSANESLIDEDTEPAAPTPTEEAQSPTETPEPTPTDAIPVPL